MFYNLKIIPFDKHLISLTFKLMATALHTTFWFYCLSFFFYYSKYTYLQSVSSVWLISLSILFPRSIRAVPTGRILPFSWWIMFHCVYILYILYLLICRWTLRLFPHLVYCKSLHWTWERIISDIMILFHLNKYTEVGLLYYMVGFFCF